MTKENVKAWFVSFWHTFAAGFLIGITPFVHSFSFSDISSVEAIKATIVGLVLAGVRAAWKAVAPLLSKAFMWCVRKLVDKVFSWFNR